MFETALPGTFASSQFITGPSVLPEGGPFFIWFHRRSRFTSPVIMLNSLLKSPIFPLYGAVSRPYRFSLPMECSTFTLAELTAWLCSFSSFVKRLWFLVFLCGCRVFVPGRSFAIPL